MTGALPLRPIREPRLGLSAARNTGVRAARGELVLFTDDDVDVDPAWLGTYVAAAGRWPDATYFAGRVDAVFETLPARWITQQRGALSGMLCELDFGPDERCLASNEHPVAPNMAVRRAAFAHADFDERLGLTGRDQIRGSETSLFASLGRRGAWGVWVPSARVRHRVACEQATWRHFWRYYSSTGRADLIHNAQDAVQQIYTTVAGPMLGVLTEGLVALGIVAVLLAAAPGVTLVAVTLLLGLSLFLLRLTRGATARLGERLDRLKAAALRDLQQALGAVKELKVLGRERGLADRYAAERRALARIGRRYGTLAALPRLVVEMVFVSAALLIVILLGARGGTGAETVPLLGLYAYAGFRVIPSVNRILWLIGEIRFGSPAVERVYRDLLILPPEVAAVPGTCAFRERLALERVSYAHETGGRPVLHEVDLVVRRGEVIGIVGPTGAGKSTLVDLVVGLLEPTAGRITVDGVDLRWCGRAWQREIGYVPQAVFLLDDTLRRNVALGVPDAEIDERRLSAAIRRAQLEAFVAGLPSGLETVVGERGARLSGGERQRIGVARALYHEPRFLVFDEATSALDGRTEAALIEALDGSGSETTMLIVAHRLTSVRHCDRLVLIRDGRIADIGSFDELVARSPEFQALAAFKGPSSV